jgi:ribosome-binding factor A
MSRAHQQGGEPSQRMLRVAELIRHALSDLLSRGTIMDPALEGKVITVPDVRMSPDLKLATAYVMPLGGKDLKEVLEALERNKKALRTEVAHKISMKFAPDLRFRADTSFDYNASVDAILQSPKVKQDLAPRDGDEE